MCVCACACMKLIVCFLDKCPALVDFVNQIKTNADTAQLFESIQADASLSFSRPTPGSAMESMDLS